MPIIKLENSQLIPDQLTRFDFQKVEEGEGLFFIEKALFNNLFRVKLSILNDFKIKTDIYDESTGEIYPLHLFENSTQPFIHQLKQEYEEFLQKIVKNCFEKRIFKSQLAMDLEHYVCEKYHVYLEFLWSKFPETAIWRCPDSKKWFGALLVVPAQKIGINEDKKIKILDLHLSPQKIKELIDYKTYFPAYHMNKLHWITINIFDIYHLKLAQ